MGKAEILSETGEGAYSIRVEFDVSRLNAAIARAQDRLSELADLVDDAEMKYSSAMTAYQVLQTKETLAAYLTAKNRVNSLAIAKLSAEKELERLQAVDDHVNMSAWCADYTTGLTGVVGTIEVPGERGRVQIRPGYDNGSAYSAGRDGQLVPTAAMTPEQAFYNLAMLPGWQKWKPTFRYGTITEIDEEGDTCSVALDPAASSQQSLAVNQANELAGVPVQYMDCNAAAFDVGDHVVVEFSGQSWESPKVIGFYSDPRPCGNAILLTINGFTPTQDYQIRLFHPDAGYSIPISCDVGEDEQEIFGQYTIAGDVIIPGGALADCYVEVRYPNCSYHWDADFVVCENKERVPAGIISGGEFFYVENATEGHIILPDLSPLARKHVWIYNVEGELFSVTQTTGGVHTLDNHYCIHAYWTGTRWSMNSQEPGHEPAHVGILIDVDGYDTLLSFTGEDVPDRKWYPQVNWLRVNAQLSTMLVGDFYNVNKEMYTLCHEFVATFPDKDAFCETLFPLLLTESTSCNKAIAGGFESETYSAPGVFICPGWIVGEWDPEAGEFLQYGMAGSVGAFHSTLIETDAVAESAVMLSDAFGISEPTYADFSMSYKLTAVTQSFIYQQSGCSEDTEILASFPPGTDAGTYEASNYKTLLPEELV